jgi:hypothetical protein
MRQLGRRVRRWLGVRPMPGPNAETADVVRRLPTHGAVEHEAVELAFEIGFSLMSVPVVLMASPFRSIDDLPTSMAVGRALAVPVDTGRLCC